MPKFLQNNFAFDSVIINVVENSRPFQGPTYSLKPKTFFMGLPKIQGLFKDSTVPEIQGLSQGLYL